MYHTVTLFFAKKETVRFKVYADTGTGALCSVLGFDWSIEQRKGFLGATVDPYKKGDVI